MVLIPLLSTLEKSHEFSKNVLGNEYYLVCLRKYYNGSIEDSIWFDLCPELVILPCVDDDVDAGVEDQQEVGEHAHIRGPATQVDFNPKLRRRR